MLLLSPILPKEDKMTDLTEVRKADSLCVTGGLWDMKLQKKLVTINTYEQRVLVAVLNRFRTELIEEDKSTDDIDNLMLKVIDAPNKRMLRREGL